MSSGKLFFAGRPLVVASVAAALIPSPLSAQQDKQSQTGKTSVKDSNIKNDSDGNSATAPDPATTTRRAHAPTAHQLLEPARSESTTSPI